MARNLSHNLKRVVAGLCAVLVVAGAVPAQPIADIFSETVITASAASYDIKNATYGQKYVQGDVISTTRPTGIYATETGMFVKIDGVVVDTNGNPQGSSQTGISSLTVPKTIYYLRDYAQNQGYGVVFLYAEFSTTKPKSDQSWTISAANATYTGSGVAGYTISGDHYGTLSTSYKGRSNTTYDSTSAPSAVGDYTVTVTYAGNDSYNARSQSVDFSITKGKGSISYSTTSVSKTYGNGTFTNALTKKGDGSVTYSSTNTNVATVNSSTGLVTIKGAGTATIKANVSDGTNYSYETNTASYTLTVNKANISPSVTMNGWTYGSAASNPSVSGNPGNGTPTYQYKVSTAANNTYSDTKPTNAGTYTVKATIPATTNYNGGTATANFTISPKTVSNPTIELDPSSYTFDGNEKKPTVTVKDGSTTIPATEYTASYSNNKNAGTATVTITDKANGNYTVSGSKNFTINKAASSASAPSAKDLTYNTNPQPLVNAGTASGGTLMYKVTTEDSMPATNTDGWRDSVPEMTNAGTYYVWYYVKGDSNHNDSAVQKVDVTIKQAENGIAAPTERTGLTYTSKAQSLVTKGSAAHGTLYYAVADTKPAADSTLWNTTIPKGTNAGTYKVWTKAVDPNGNYKTVISEEAVEVTIAKKDITGAQVILSATNVPSKTTVPNVTLVVVDGSIVVPADDYTTNHVVGTDNIGTLTVTAESGSTNFTGSATAEYVVGTDIRDADVDMIETYEYTGEHIHPPVHVIYEGELLHEETDYTVFYDDDNNVSIGTSAVKIKGKGNYAGTITKTLSITAKNVSECTPEIADHVIYTGEALTPELTMKNGDVIMKQGSADGDRKDYITYYSSNTDVGTATIIVVGSGNYKDSCKVTFNIKGQLGTDGTASQFTTANVNKKISLDENGNISAESFGSGDIDVAFAGKTLTKDTDYTVTVKTYDSASKTGVITLTGKGSYEGSVDVPFTTKNKYQTLTVADAIHENVKVGTFENSSEYSQLIPGEKYTIENNTGYVLTLKSDSDSVADVTIGKDKTVTFEVEDDVNYSLAIHTHRLIATNIDGALYVTCEDGDSTNTLLANIDTVASYTYGTPITPGVVVNEDEQDRTSNIQLKVYDSDDEEVSVSALATSDVGTYTVRASLMYNGATYNLEKSFEITPKEITLTPDPDQSKTYGNADPTQFTYTTDGLIAKDVDNVAFDQYIKRQPGDIVSEYSYVLFKGETPYPTGGLTVGNYKISLADNSPKFKISPKAISVTLTDNSFIYGDIKNSTDLVETFGANIDQDDMEYFDSTTDVPITLTIAGSTYTTAGYLNANETGYSITATTTNANYKLNVPQTLVINKKDIEGAVKLDETEFGYTHEDKTVNVVTNDGDKLTVSSDVTVVDTDSTVTAMNANEYSVKVTATNDGNYTGTTTLTWIITPHALVDADISFDDSVVYNAAEQRPVINVAGVGNGEDTLVKDTDYIVISDGSGKNVGEYTVQIRGNGNYTGTASKTFNITKAQQEVNVTPKTMVYDGAAVDLANDFVVSSEGLTEEPETVVTLKFYTKNGDDYTPVDEAKNAGTYYVTATVAATANYEEKTSEYVEFEITRRPITVTPDAGQSQVYGAKTENLAFTVDGLQGNDTQDAVFAVNPLMVVDSNNTKLANDHILQAGGSYFLTVDPDVVYDNYVTVLDGTAPAYTVTKRSIVDVSAEDIKITSEAAFVYDGNSHAVEYQTKDHVYNYGGTLVEKDLAADTDYQVTGSSGIIAKEYSLQFKGNGNYNNVKQLPWSITAKAIAAKIVAVTNDLTYNGQNVGGNFSVKTTNGDDLPAGAVVTLTYTGRNGTVYEESTTAPTNAGKYTVTATATLKNYTITFADSYAFEIKQKAVTVTPDPGQTKVYGTETPEITYSLNGVIEGEDVDFTSGIVSVNCDKWADVTDTGYAYSIVDTDQGNYTLALDTAAGTFKVTPKNINEITFELDSAKVPLLNDEADASAHIIAQYGEKTLEKDTDYTLDGDTSSFVAKDGLEMTVMGIGNYTGSKDIAWSAVEKQAAVYSNSLTLNGEIIFKINVGFNSYEDLSGKTITAKLTSSVDDTRSSTYNLDPVAGERLSSNNFGYDQAYRFQIPLAPAEIGDTIFIEVFADGESIFKTNTSVLDYCRRMLRNPSNTEEFKSLLAALIDYATAAQDYFGYNSDNKADQIFTENDFSSYVDYGMKYVENGQDFETVINNTIVDKAAINSTLSELLDGSDIKLEYTSSMFNHSSGQFMRHFFTVENATVADAVAEFSDRFGIASDEISVRVYGDEANNRIVVETSVIPQAYLRDYDKLSITLDGQTVFGYTCIDYAAVMNEKYSIEKLNKLNEKFYYFSIAAYKYYIG